MVVELHFDVMRVDLPYDSDRHSSKLWNHVDEVCVEPGQSVLLGRNGIRIGVAPADVIGRPAVDFIHADDAPLARSDYVEAHRTGRPTPGRDQRLVTSDGSARWISSTACPILEGDRRLFVVATGQLRAHVGDRDLVDRGPGDVVGELALLSPGTRSATVTALTPSLLLRLRRRPFEELLDDRPEIARAVIASLARRLQELADPDAPCPLYTSDAADDPHR